MVSDDTEHAMMTLQAYLKCGGSEHDFARAFGWSLRGWLLGLPAGIGLATLKATLKLAIGVPPSRSGVNSAGNGPAMRAPVLGAILADDPNMMRRLVDASTRVTHTHPLAVEGALIVAYSTAFAASGEVAEPRSFIDSMRADLDLGEKWNEPLERAIEFLNEDRPAAAFMAVIGKGRGVSGYILETVPACLYCWLQDQQDFKAAVEQSISLGGDTDTVGAITGGIVGAGVGEAGIPKEWIEGIKEWPRNVDWMRRLSARAAEGSAPLPWVWPLQVPRNLLFLGAVLTHGFRRLLPPY